MKEWVKSVYSDTTRHYVSNPYPKKGEQITITLRVRENADIREILLRYKQFGIERLVEMELTGCERGLAYYSAEVTVEEKAFRYQFYLVTANKIYYYTQYRITDYIPDESQDFVILADYQSADWVENTVFYQIFPDRFCNGNPHNNVKDGEYHYQGYETIQVKQWNTPAAEYEESHGLDFYNGDLYGVIEKLDYLQELGINGIYLNPIFISPSVHKYDSLDYFQIDPHLGGNEALRALIEEMHRRDMKLMMDISINHVSSASKWFNKNSEFYDSSEGAYQNVDSPLRDYFFIDKEGKYDTWCGVETMPKLNYGSESLRKVIYRDKDSVLKKWISQPYGIDGWRFDVADCLARNKNVDVHREVITEIRGQLKTCNPHLYLLAEDWADCSVDLQGDAWDATMNYFGCARPIREFVGECDLFHARDEVLKNLHIKLTAKQLSERIIQFYAKLPGVIQHQMFNLLDSHDVTRLYNNPAVNEEEFRGAVMMMFTLPGTPSVYYGDEILLDGTIQSMEACRYPMDWEWEKREEACRNREFYQQLIRIKRNSEALRDGGFQIVSDEGYVFAFARFTKQEVIFVICSTDEKEQKINLPIGNFGVTAIETNADYFGSPIHVQNDVTKDEISLFVPAHQSYLIQAKIN